MNQAAAGLTGQDEIADTKVAYIDGTDFQWELGEAEGGVRGPDLNISEHCPLLETNRAVARLSPNSPQ